MYKKIAFDLDGIFVNTQKYLLEKGTKFFHREPVNRKTLDVKEMFGVSKKLEYLFWGLHILDYCNNLELNPATFLLMKELLEADKDVHIITGRMLCNWDNPIGEYFRRSVIRAFRKAGVSLDESKFHFVSYKNAAEEKKSLLTQNNFDCIIEDSSENVAALSGTSVEPIIKLYDYNEDISENVKSFHTLISIKNHLLGDERKFVYLTYEEREKLSTEELKKYYEKLKDYYRNYNSQKDLVKCDNNRYNYYSFGQIFYDKFINAEVRNVENIPKKDGFIIVANHQNLIDAYSVLKALGKDRSMFPLLKNELSKSVIAPIYNKIGAIYVEKGNKDSEYIALDKGTNIVLTGRNLLIFPEGTRNKTKKALLDFKKGALLIAQRTSEPIVPITIAYDADNGRNIITVLPPVNVSYDDNICEVKDYLMKIMEECLVETGYQRGKKSNL